MKKTTTNWLPHMWRHKVNVLACALLLAGFAQVASAQVIVGTGTTTARFPFSFWYGYSRNAAIYTASELNTVTTGGTITTLSWYSNSASSTVGPVVIYLKPVGTTTAVAADTWANTIAGATQVYTGTPAAWVSGWNTIDITDFPVAAGQNVEVLLECNVTGGGSGNSTSTAFRFTDAGTNNHAYWQSDTNPPTGTPSQSTSGAINSSRPNITFGGLVAPTCLPPTGVTVPVATITANTATINWSAPATTTPTSYQWEVRTTGTPGSGSPAASGSVTAPTLTANAGSLTAGNTYIAYVRSVCGGSDFSSWTAGTTFQTSPANDNASGAVGLTVNGNASCVTSTTGTTISATQSAEAAPGCTAAGIDDDVWYTFTASAAIHAVTFSGVSTGTMVGALYTGTPGSLTPVAGACGSTSFTANGLSIGTIYYVRAYNTATSSAIQSNFTICITSPPPPPANDECSSPVTLTVAPYSVSGCTSAVSGTTVSATSSSITAPPSSAWSTSQDDDVWYQFTATNTLHVIRFCNVTFPIGAAVDMAFSINAGCTASNPELVGTSVALTSGSGSYSVTGLTVGTLYKIRVLTNGTSSRANFDISVMDPPPMTYVSSTTTQASTSSVTAGAINQQILGVQVVAIGVTGALNVTQLTFNTTGSTSPADIVNAKVYSTGTSSTFATTTPFGTPVLNPNGTFSVTGSQALTGGASNSTNYFWLTYDVSCAATVSNVLDAQCTSITAGSAQTPTVTDPSGTRSITAATAPSYTAATTTNVAAGSADFPMGRTNISGTSCAGTVTEVKFNTATSPVADISRAKCYYTTSTTFGTATAFGSPVVSPSGDIVFTGSQALASGSGNYFWLAYDLPCNAVVADSLSAIPVSITANAVVTNLSTPASNPKKGITAQTSYSTVSDGEWSNGATWACGAPPSDANNVTINHNVTVASSGNKVGNVTIAAGKSLIITSGNLTMGPDGGGNKTLTNNGILTINGGTLNANGNVILAAGCTFNMSSGNLNIDPNNGTSGGSVASGTTIFAIGSSSSAITANVTGGNILINDPPFAGSGYSVAMNTNVAMAWAGNTIQFGGTTGIHPSANGFIVECYVNSNRLAFGNVIINGNDPAKPVTDATYGLSAVNNLTINPESELRIGSGSFSSFAGNITNNGTLTVTGALRLEAPVGSLTSSTPSTNAQAISGSGIFRNSISSPTANFTNLVINNTNTNGVTFNANALLSGANTGTLSGTLTMTTGIVNTGGNSLVVGISNAAAGTYTYSGGVVMGKLKRWIAAATGSTVFNIGNAAGAKTATINFTTAPTAAGSLTAEWVSGDPGANGLPQTEGSNNLAYVSTNGYWRITAGDGLAGGTYTATFNGVSVADVSDYTQLTIGKRANAAANWSLDGTYAAPTGSNANFIVSRTGITTGFSEFGILMGGAPLPVTLESFSGKNAGSVNNLSWQTAEEKNFSHFELLRSADGKDFSKLTTINATGNASGSSYAYTDERPFEGKNFYRLNMVDADGRARLSDVVELSVKSGSGLAVSIHPNPVAQQLHININGKMDGKGQIQVLDITGKVLQSVPVSNSSISVDMSQLPAGTYMIRYTDNSHQQLSKVTKN